MTIPVERFPIVDNPHADVIYADQVTCFLTHQGNIRMTLECFRLNVGPEAKKTPGCRVVIGALCMPAASAEALAKGLLNFIEVQKEQHGPPDGPNAAVPLDRTIN